VYKTPHGSYSSLKKGLIKDDNSFPKLTKNKIIYEDVKKMIRDDKNFPKLSKKSIIYEEPNKHKIKNLIKREIIKLCFDEYNHGKKNFDKMNTILAKVYLTAANFKKDKYKLLESAIDDYDEHKQLYGNSFQQYYNTYCKYDKDFIDEAEEIVYNDYKHLFG
jgi:ribonuclease HIII